MLIGAIIFTAVLFTLIVLHIISLRAQNSHSLASTLPYKSPFAVFLTFINCLLFVATVSLVLHQPFEQYQRSSLFATFAGAEPQPTGFYPETTISLIYPEQPIFQNNNQDLPESSPSPEPTLSKEPAEKKTVNFPEGTAISEGEIIVIAVGGEVKGYTSEYLNSISLLRDFHNSTRVMVQVKNSRVIFSNLDTGEKLSAQSVSQDIWQQSFPDEVLQDLIIEEAEPYEPLL